MKLYLAPINLLSNNAFRKLAISLGADFVFTEMVWAERILNGSKFEECKLLIDDEKRTVIQIIAEEPKNIGPFVKLLKKRFPDVLELNFNMGCPQSTMSRKMLGGGILKDRGKMEIYCTEFSKACKRHGFMPSVKIRTGVHKSDVNEYVELIKNTGISKIYIHARTLTQGYVRPADYSSLSSLKDFSDVDFVVNGDITDEMTLKKAVSSVKCSGAMIGRAALIDPTIFSRLKGKKHPSRKDAILQFLEYAIDMQIATVKKNVSWMTMHTVKGASVRGKINNAKTVDDVKNIVESAEIS